VDSNINKPNAQNNVYDLNGSKVANPQKGQIYIINGKKEFLSIEFDDFLQ